MKILKVILWLIIWVAGCGGIQVYFGIESSHLLGLFLLINSQNNITGAFIGPNFSVALTSSLGFFFIFISGIIFLSIPNKNIFKN